MQYLLSAKALYVNSFHTLSYLIPTTTLKVRYYYCYHFTDEETESHNDCHLFKIPQLIICRVRMFQIDHSFMLGRTQPAHFFLNLIMSFLFKAIGSPSVSFFSLQFIPQIPKTFYLLSFSVWILLTVCSWCGSTCSSDLCIYFKLAAGFGAFIRLKFYLYGKIIDGFIL